VKFKKTEQKQVNVDGTAWLISQSNCHVIFLPDFHVQNPQSRAITRLAECAATREDNHNHFWIITHGTERNCHLLEIAISSDVTFSYNFLRWRSQDVGMPDRNYWLGRLLKPIMTEWRVVPISDGRLKLTSGIGRFFNGSLGYNFWVQGSIHVLHVLCKVLQPFFTPIFFVGWVANPIFDGLCPDL
jgi:hypothetical protein